MASKRSPLPAATLAPDRVLVGIANEAEQVRIGFQHTLEQAGFEVAVSADTMADLEVALRDTPGVKVLLVQLRPPRNAMKEDLERLMRRTKLPVIVVGALSGEVAEEMVQLEVSGLLNHTVRSTELVQAVQVVAQGGMHRNNWLTDQLKKRRKRPSAAERRSSVKISAKNQQAGQWLFDHPDLSLPKLAVLVNINVRTLESRKGTLFKLLGVRTRDAFMKFRALHG
jgi:DNA-binding NarL/FixJ family response regulator